MFPTNIFFLVDIGAHFFELQVFPHWDNPSNSGQPHPPVEQLPRQEALNPASNFSDALQAADRRHVQH